MLNRDRALRKIYQPGHEENFITETNYTNDRDHCLHELWNSWAKYWNTSKPVLVEKSPTNIGKTRWLASVFQPIAKSIRFLIIVKSPVTNSHFAMPRHCPGDSDCSVGDNLLRARVLYIQKWANVHERFAEQLRSWDNSSLPFPSSTMGVVRYEQVSTPCVCESIVSFAFGDDGGDLSSLPFSDCCASSPKCKHPAGRRRMGYQGHLNQPVSISMSTSARHRINKWANVVKKPMAPDIQERLRIFDPRLRKFGYFVLPPLEQKLIVGDEETDPFARWAIT